MNKALVLVCVIVAFAARPAAATERCVPADYPTIQAAVDAAAPNDVVCISGGTYPGPIRIDGKNRLTIQAISDAPVIIDARKVPYGIVARNLDGLVIRSLTIQGYPGKTNRAGILLDGAGVAGGGPAPLSRIVITYCGIQSPGNGIEINGDTVHVVNHCNDIAVGGEFGVGWGSNDLIRVKYSRISSIPGTSPKYGIYAAGTCEPFTDGTVAYRNRIIRNQIEGSFLEGMRFQNVQDHIVSNNVVRLDSPAHPLGDTVGIVFGAGCAPGPVSTDVSVLSNDVAGGRYALLLGSVDGAGISMNRFSRNGSSTALAMSPLGFGGAVRIGLPDAPGAPACHIDVQNNEMRGLLSPRSVPAVMNLAPGACARDNVVNSTNRVDMGRPLVGP